MVTSETKFLEQTDYIIVMKNQVNEPLMSVNDVIIDVMILQLLLIGGESCVLIRCPIVSRTILSFTVKKNHEYLFLITLLKGCLLNSISKNPKYFSASQK